MSRHGGCSVSDLGSQESLRETTHNITSTSPNRKRASPRPSSSSSERTSSTSSPTTTVSHGALHTQISTSLTLSARVVLIFWCYVVPLCSLFSSSCLGCVQRQHGEHGYYTVVMDTIMFQLNTAAATDPVPGESASPKSSALTIIMSIWPSNLRLKS